MAIDLDPRAFAELCPSGTLRVGINHQNFLLVLRGSTDADPRGPAPDLARELARRIGAPIRFVGFSSAGKLADAARDRVWDVAFLAADPEREAEIAFTAPYLEIPATYLVPAGSPLATIDDVDREGVRISTAAKSAYELYLRRHVKRATLVLAPSVDASFQRFVDEGLEALSGLRPRLLEDLEKLPGARLLEGRFTAVQQAIGTHRDRPEAAAYLRAFVEDAKASGLVARAIADNGVPGVAVAKPA